MGVIGGNIMAENEEIVFFAGYGLVILMIGLMIGLFSMGFFDAWLAFTLWLLFTSFILVGLGGVKTENAPQGSMALAGTGIVFLIISIGFLGAIFNILHPFTSIAILIFFIGLAIIWTGIRKARK